MGILFIKKCDSEDEHLNFYYNINYTFKVKALRLKLTPHYIGKHIGKYVREYALLYFRPF